MYIIRGERTELIHGDIVGVVCRNGPALGDAASGRKGKI